MRAAAILLSFTTLACAAPPPENPPPPTPAFVAELPEFTGDPGELVRAHAHNDYYNFEPLLTALKNRFYSVEVDVYLREGRIVVAHYVFEDYGDLGPMYLDRIAAVVRARGSVYGDGRPFTLWIDLKEDDDALTDAIHDALARDDDVFTSWTGDDGVTERPVVVVLTGSAAKERYAERPLRYAIRDSNSLSASDPDADLRWAFYALNFDDVLAARGPGVDEDTITTVVDEAHALGRAVRFYSAPDDEDAWRLQLRAGADFIGTDEVVDFAAAFTAAE